MQAKLTNYTVSIIGAGMVMTLTYPSRGMATNAFEFAWECCARFSQEARMHPDDGAPIIYVYGEMYKPAQFMNKLASLAEKAGAVVEVTN